MYFGNVFVLFDVKTTKTCLNCILYGPMTVSLAFGIERMSDRVGIGQIGAIRFYDSG